MEQGVHIQSIATICQGNEFYYLNAASIRVWKGGVFDSWAAVPAESQYTRQNWKNYIKFLHVIIYVESVGVRFRSIKNAIF